MMDKEKLIEISKLLHTQDNRITAQPMFAVQRKVRDYGYDSDYSDDIAWIDGCNDYIVADEEEYEKLESRYTLYGEMPDGWIRTAYRDRWEFVTACFTEQGCKDFIARDGHNLGETRIYAYGSYRNNEYQTVRNYLMSLTDAGIPVTEAKA